MDVSCDLQVDVNGEQVFMVDKKVICSYSGRINKLIGKSKRGTRYLKVIFHDFPGGAESFELITRFCYSKGKIEINSVNVSTLYCAASYMEMKKSVSGNQNLFELTEKSLEDVRYWTWSELLDALRLCQNLMPVASSSGVIDKYLDSLIGRVASSCETSPCPSTSSADSSGFRLSCDTKSTESLRNSAFRATWWFEDLASFEPFLIETLVKQMVSKNIDHGLLSKFLFCYQKSRFSVADEKCKTMETVIEMLHLLDSSCISFKTLFGMLRITLTLKISKFSPQTQGPETRGTVIIEEDDDDDEVIPGPLATRAVRRDRTNDDIFGGDSTAVFSGPSAPGGDVLPDYANDIEEEMVRAAIEASRRDAEMSTQQFDVNSDLSDSRPQPRESHLEDAELARAVSLSLKAAEQEKAMHEGSKAIPESEGYKPAEENEHGKSTISNGRQFRSEVGSSSIQDEAEDLEEEPLVWRRRKPISSGSETAQDVEERVVSPLSSPRQNLNHSPRNGADFQSDEWGGMSSLEHDEAVMLEAAIFGGIPEGTGYRLPSAPRQPIQNGADGPMGPYQWRMPRAPSPSLVAQRLLREQQDDEYHAALQADREKELKAKQEAEAALEEKRLEEEELRRKAEEEKEMERQLAAKEASLPQEPTADNENAVNLVVRMPDGSRRGRRFLKSDRLQSLFDYIDIGRVIKPGTYRLVRPYPRRAFSDGESTVSLDELGLTSKQEALFLESI